MIIKLIGSLILLSAIPLLLWIGTVAKKKQQLFIIYTVVFMLYIFMILFITIIGRSEYNGKHIQLIPFRHIYIIYTNIVETIDNFRQYGRYGQIKMNSMDSVLDAFLNIVLFVPFGGLRCTINQRCGLKQVFISGFFFSLTIEILELLTARGCFETDDLITNTLGAVVGFFVYKYCCKAIKKNTAF